MRLAIVGLLGILILGLIGFPIYRVVTRNQREQAGPPLEPGRYKVAGRDILPGEVVRPEDLKEEVIQPPAEQDLRKPREERQAEANRTYDEQIGAGTYRTDDQIVGQTATVRIAAGGKFSEQNLKAPPETVSAKIRAGYVAFTMQTPPKPSLYDLKFLNPDEFVDVFGVQKPKDDSQPVTVLLAQKVRLLAVDKVKDKFEEEQRIKKLEAEIAQLEQQKTQAGPGGVPLSAEQTKAIDDQITAKRAQIDAKPENPSVTVEVTGQQAQLLAFWRSNYDLDIALHQEVSPSQLLDVEQGALPTGTQLAAMSAGPQVIASVPILTLEDVVPLSLRSRNKYSQELEAEQRILTLPSERRLQQLENDVEATRLQVELRNLQRYGTSTPPVELNAPPVLAPVAGGGDLGEVKELLGQMQRDIRELKGGTAPAPYRHRIEVIRGTEVEVVES